MESDSILLFFQNCAHICSIDPFLKRSQYQNGPKNFTNLKIIFFSYFRGKNFKKKNFFEEKFGTLGENEVIEKLLTSSKI